MSARQAFIMANHYDRTFSVLERFLSPPVARALLMRVVKDQGVSADQLSAGDLRRMSSALRRGLRLFVDPEQRAAAEEAIANHCGEKAELPSAVSLPIKTEFDIGKIRVETRRICTACGASAFAMQKVATVVSELARNMLLYADGGHMDLTPQSKGQRGRSGSGSTMKIVAKDQGKGIPNLPLIMSGDYRSKTGLGRGLLGTKRLAEVFDIKTGPRGTCVTVEIAL